MHSRFVGHIGNCIRAWGGRRYDIAIDTILMCFCEDRTAGARTKEYFSAGPREPFGGDRTNALVCAILLLLLLFVCVCIVCVCVCVCACVRVCVRVCVCVCAWWFPWSQCPTSSSQLSTGAR